MVRRYFDSRKLLLIGVLSFLVFSLGVVLGFLIDNERVRWVIQVNRGQEVDYESLQLQYLYINGIESTNVSCVVFKKALETTVAELGQTLDKLLAYKKDSEINRKEFDLLSRKYVLDNLRFWVFAQRTKKLCGLNYLTVLYFYSDKECSICPDQGVILTYFKKKFGDQLLIFPINTDSEKEEKMITILRAQYNITEEPSIVIEDELLTGFTNKEVLGSRICAHFPAQMPECKSDGS